MVFVVSFIFLWIFQSLFLSSVTSPSVPVCLLFILLSVTSCFILNIISSCGFLSILCFHFFPTPSCRLSSLLIPVFSLSLSDHCCDSLKSQFVSPVWLLCTWIWTFGFMFRTSSLELLYTLHFCHCCHSIFYGVCSWAHTWLLPQSNAFKLTCKQ